MDENHRLECGKMLQDESGKISFLCEICCGEFLSLGLFIRHQTMTHGAVRPQPFKPTMTHADVRFQTLKKTMTNGTMGTIRLQPVQRAIGRILPEKQHPVVLLKDSNTAITQKTLAPENDPITICSSSDETTLPVNWKCKHCRKEFDSSAGVDAHRDICKPIHRINCDYCAKTFLTTGGLRIHIHRNHKLSIPFVCDACPKSFNKPSELTMHRHTHGTERKVLCDFCDQRFLTKFERVAHMKYDHPNDKYRCAKCLFDSRKIGVVRRHQSLRHGI